jgi:hypothetical protein
MRTLQEDFGRFEAAFPELAFPDPQHHNAPLVDILRCFLAATGRRVEGRKYDATTLRVQLERIFAGQYVAKSHLAMAAWLEGYEIRPNRPPYFDFNWRPTIGIGTKSGALAAPAEFTRALGREVPQGLHDTFATPSQINMSMYAADHMLDLLEERGISLTEIK